MWISARTVTRRQRSPNKTRESAEKAFSKLFRPRYRSRAALRILGRWLRTGLPALPKAFPKATMTGVDVFRRGSMSELSMEKASTNMESLGISSTTSFLSHDLTKPLKGDVQYDLAALGRKRFVAYWALALPDQGLEKRMSS
jgi:hypothetical protein